MPRDWWTSDRRRGNRRIVPFPLLAGLQGSAEPVRVHELGPGGMVVESARALLAGDGVTVTLGTGVEAIGPLEGHVAHSRLILPVRHGEPPVYLAGVAFQHVTPAHAVRIAAWLADIDDRGGHRRTQVP